MKICKLSLLSLIAATLVACGGGDGDGDGDAADKFAGTWGQCVPVTGTPGLLSVRSVFVYTKTGANNLTMSINGTGYSAANCAGTKLNTTNGIATGTVVINGTKVINGQTVYRFDTNSVSSVASLNGNFKDVALITGTTFTFGNGANDAEGYPTVLDSTGVFTKQ
jgi:hypothetical protein